jgi:hypothetical protein
MAKEKIVSRHLLGENEKKNRLCTLVYRPGFEQGTSQNKRSEHNRYTNLLIECIV